MKKRGKNLNRRLPSIVLSILVFSGSLGSLQAATSTRTWDGSYSIYWSAPENWVEGITPTIGDNLVFPAGAANKANNNNIGLLTLNSISFSDSGYTLSGNPITLLSGIEAWAVGSSNTIEFDIELGAAQMFDVTSSTSSLYVNGDVNLAYTLTLYGPGSVHMGGVISGTAGIETLDVGTHWLEGSSANTYTGPTQVHQGTLILAKTAFDGAVNGGTLYVGNQIGFEDTAIVRLQNHYQLSNIPIVIYSDGWLDMDDYYDTVGTITFNGGHAGSTAYGILALGGDVTVNAFSDSAVMDGRVNLGITQRSFIVANGTAGYDLIVNAALVSGGFVKTGLGSMRLDGANTYSGATTVSQGGLYVLNASAFGDPAVGTTVNGSGYIQLVSTIVESEELTLNNAYTGGGCALYASGTSGWAGPVVLQEDAGISTGGTLDFSGVISGSGGMHFTGYGDYIFSGTNANTYAGNTYVEDGTLYLDKDPIDGALSGPGSLVISNELSSVVVQELQSYQIGNSVNITVYGAGVLDLNNFSDTLGAISLYGGNITTGTGTLTLGNDVLATSISGNPANIYGHIASWSASRTFSLPYGPFGPDVHIGAQISGSSDFLFTGMGSAMLHSSNTITGTVTVDDFALLWVNHASALGSTNQGTVINGHARIGFDGGIYVEDEPLVLNSASTVGAIWVSDGTNSWAGPVTLQHDTTVAFFSAFDPMLTLECPISGVGGLMQNNGGTLVLSGPSENSYDGDTTVEGGVLVLDKTGTLDAAIQGNLIIGDGYGGAGADIVRLARSNQIKNTADVTIASSGLLDLVGSSNYDRVNSVTGNGSIDLADGHLIAGHSGSTFTFDGVVSGSGYLWKVGNGDWTLTADNTYSGQTRVEYGTLIVNGSQPSSGVYIYPTGTLGGTGAVGNVICDGTEAPGSSAGHLSTGNNFLQPSSSFNVELDGYSLADYDQLDVTGIVFLDDPVLSVNWGFVPAQGDSFTIIDNDGVDAVSGTFNGLPEGSTLVADNVELKITYAGGTGNDVVLSATNVKALEDLAITSIDVSGGYADLTWTGGVPFFRIEKKTSLTNATWTAITSPTRDFSGHVTADTSNAFYRVTGGN